VSKIKTEVEHYKTGLAKTDQSAISRFSFPQEFIGFQGHFPTKKVLPGACQIQCAITTIEKTTGKAVGLKEIILAKYVAPVFPDEEISCKLVDTGEEGTEPTFKVTISKADAKVAELKLRVVFKSGKKKSDSHEKKTKTVF